MAGELCIEHAKSGRAGCKRCFQKIDAYALRVGVSSIHPQYGMVSSSVASSRAARRHPSADLLMSTRTPTPRRPGDGSTSRAPTCPRFPRAPAPSSPASTASPPPRSSRSSHCWERPQQGSSERLHRLLPRRRLPPPPPPPPPLPPALAAPPRPHPPQRRRRRRKPRNSQPESTSRGLTTRKEIARSNTRRPRNPVPAWR